MAKKILSETEEYFAKYQDGWTIKDIAIHYDHAISTIRYKLAKHPKYKPPGSGNRTSRWKKKGESIGFGYDQINASIHPDLHDKLKAIPGNKSEHIRKAISEYCDRYEKKLKKAKS